MRIAEIERRESVTYLYSVVVERCDGRMSQLGRRMLQRFSVLENDLFGINVKEVVRFLLT